LGANLANSYTLVPEKGLLINPEDRKMKSKGIFRLVFLTVVATMLAVAQPHANALTLQPTGLGPGDTYQLVFVTAAKTNATPPDINTYNDFVQTQANNADIGIDSTAFGFDVTWKAIISTETVNARDNAVVQATVFNLNDQRVADDYNDMWDGDIDNPILYDEGGQDVYERVWTGSLSYGQRHALSYYAGFVDKVFTGYSGSYIGSWIFSGKPQHYTSSYSLYALSQAITVPGPIPEPTTMLLLGSGLIGLIAFRRRLRIS